MAYKHVDKESGQLIKADDWNAMGRELERLEGAKVQRNGGDAIDGDLKVTGSLELGRGKAIKEFSADKKLGDNSDLAVPTESAVKSYVDDALKQKAALDGAPGQDFQTKRLSVSGNLHLAKDREIFFADNGQIRSLDDNHRILFRRSSNTMELREWGDITFSPGATDGKETAKVVMSGSGNVGIGTPAPEARLDVRGDVQIVGAAAAQYKIELMGSAFDSKDGNKTYLNVDDKTRKITNNRGLNTVVLRPDGTFKKNAAHDVYAKSAAWNDWADWVNANAQAGDVVAVATFDALSNAPDGGSAMRLLDAIHAEKAFLAVKGHPRSPYALLFIQGGSGSMEVSHRHKGPNAKLSTTSRDLAATAGLARLSVRGVIRADRFEATRPDLLRHRMYPDNAIVYQEIFDAQNKGAIAKLGKPQYDESTYKKKLWGDRHLIRFGGDNEADGNGAQVNIPADYDTVWVRVLGDRWTVFKAYFMDGAKENLGLWAGGYRSANGYCPDGSLSDGYNAPNHQIKGGSKLRVDLHQWLPIPARRAGKLALVAKLPTNWDFWLSGLAFSSNPWAHAAQSAVAYHWKLNGGTAAKWNTHNWNQDVLAQIDPKSNFKLMVPVVPSGRDKLLYLVEHNNNWNGCAHNGITVNGQPIERFLATYDNPFARHWNSKFYERYIAARIPAGLIPDNARWLNVQIDMSKQNQSIYFREIGTHDLDLTMNA